MGGVPVLLMMAAVSITYGWQPDNNGGVEYVIQIPPDQLDEIERIGEISSVIDPAVQGHVSRVIIKVGNSKLPRVTPPNLARPTGSASGAVMAVSDHSPVPIPEMGDTSRAIAIPSHDPIAARTAAAGQAAVMKPQTGQPTNPGGFNYPTQSSVPPSLLDPATARSGVDRAGRDIVNQAPQPAGNASTTGASDARFPLVPPPGTRAPQGRPTLGQTQALAQAQTPPPFTSSGEPARTRLGGPSTEPAAAARENSWSQMGGPSLAGARAGGPSTEPVGPSGFGASSAPSNPQRNAANSTASPAGANGLSAADSFGKMPGGLSPSGGANNRTNPFDRNPATSSTAFTQSQNGAGQGGAIGSGANPFGQGSSAANNAPQSNTGLNRATPSDPSRSNPSFGNPRLSNPSLANPSLRNPSLRNPSLSNPSLANPSLANPSLANPSLANPSLANPSLANPSLSNPSLANPSLSNPSLSNPNRSNQSLANQNRGNPPPNYARPDPRLTAAQIAAGAWSVDDYGQVYDRQGRLFTPSNPNTGLANYDPAKTSSQLPTGYPDRTSTSLGRPNPNQPVFAGTSAPPPPPYGYDPSRPATADPRLVRETSRSTPPARSDLERRSELDRPTTNRDLRADPPSLSTHRPSIAVGDAASRPVASQPFFNTLLLLSFVANVYLVFWLKNLRVQFHDLVASKRMANSNSSPT